MPLEDFDPTELVPVTRAHLQEFMTALNWAYGLASALDVAEGYRAGNPNGKTSRVTNLIARAYNHLEGYLNEDLDVSPE